jgi:hypothetical protein
MSCLSEFSYWDYDMIKIESYRFRYIIGIKI